MLSFKGRLLAVALLAAMAGTVGCNSGSKAPAKKADAQATKPAEAAPTEAPANVESLPFYAKGPVALIDGVEVPAERFNFIAERRAQQVPGGMPGQMVEIYKKQTLDMVIDEFLIERKIATDKVEVTPEDVDKAFNEFKTRFNDDEIFKQFMEHNKIDEKVIREDISKDVALRKMIAKTSDVEISDEKAKAFYEENKQRWEEQEEVSARHVLFKLEPGADEATAKAAQTKAEDVAKKAKGGEDFAELAKAQSECPSASRGGDLGFFPKNRMVPEFAEAAFKMKKGDISAPVRSQFGWHVIKVEDHKDARTVPYEEVAEQIKLQLQAGVMREAITKLLEDLKKEAKIELKDDNIVVNVPATPPGGEMGGIPGLDPSQLQLQMGGQGGQPAPGGEAAEGHEGHDHGDHAGHDHP